MFFFFNDTATTEIYTLSLHDALPICRLMRSGRRVRKRFESAASSNDLPQNNQWTAPILITCASEADRKSTRLNSSHANISYAVFCLKKKKKTTTKTSHTYSLKNANII